MSKKTLFCQSELVSDSEIKLPTVRQVQN